MNYQAAITPAGIEAIKAADADIDTLEVIVLIMLLPAPKTAVEIVTLVRKHHEAYYFVDVKYIATALAQLEDRGFVTYKSSVVEPPKAARLSRRERRRARYVA